MPETPEMIGRVSLAGSPSRPIQYLLLYIVMIWSARSPEANCGGLPVRSVESGSSAWKSCYRSHSELFATNVPQFT